MTEEIEEVRDEIRELVESVQSELDQGFHSVENAVVAQSSIEKSAAHATHVGLHGELDLLRRLHDQVERQKYELLLHDVIDKLDHGSRPPDPGYEWQWDDHAEVITRSRALGLDVRRAEEAVASAREVAASWERDRRGIEDDLPPRRRREPVSVGKPSSSAATEKPQRSVPPVDAPRQLSPTTANGPQQGFPAVGTRSPQRPEPPPDGPSAATARRPLPSGVSLRYLSVLESLRWAGGGAKATSAILVAVRQAVSATDLGNQSGTRAAIFATLHRAGVMNQIPSDRASRDAMNDNLAHHKLAFTRRSAADWVFHIGDLREPSVELEAALNAEIKRLEAERLATP